MVLLLWINCFCVLCSSCFCVCSLLSFGHLLGKGWPLGSCCWCLLYLCYFPMWYPVSGMVLDCIVSWSFLFSLLLFRRKLPCIYGFVIALPYYGCICVQQFIRRSLLVQSTMFLNIKSCMRTAKVPDISACSSMQPNQYNCYSPSLNFPYLT